VKGGRKMGNEKIREQYIEWASTYDKDKVTLFENAGIDYHKFMDSFIKCCNLRSGMNILDVGAGTGLTSISIARMLSKECTILGIEPVDEMIERARSNITKESLHDVITMKKGTGEDIPCRDGSFDLITCTFALRHMDSEKALREFRRVSKPGGRIVIADICAPEKWRTFYGKILVGGIMKMITTRKYKGEARSTLLTTHEWEALLEKMGLRLLELQEFCGRKDPEWELKRIILSARKSE
jgi:ubiquinone/menaquinone biosynthesis C-methylase UbiE